MSSLDPHKVKVVLNGMQETSPRPIRRRTVKSVKKYGTCMDCGKPVLHRSTKRCRACYAQSKRGAQATSGDAAHGAVKRALQRGELIRPEACAKCGATGRRIEAHHHRGYGPEFHLDIVWLCTSCHQDLHHLPSKPVTVIHTQRQARNTSSKLTNEQADEVVARHAAGEGYKRIARDYDVHPMTIQRIVKGRTYRKAV